VSPPDLSKVKVGDTLLYRQGRRGSGEVRIKRIGRKYLTIEIYGREYPFDKVTGYKPSGNGERVLTQEMADHEQRLDAVMDRLKKYGFDVFRSEMRRMRVKVLEQCADLLDAEAER
jgi:hypothetical protein